MDSGFGKKLDTAWAALSMHHGISPSIGVILGSGLGEFARSAPGTEVEFSAIPGFPRPTVAGHSGLIKLGPSAAVMAGRIHFYEGHPIDDVVLPVFLLHRFGVRTLIVTNAAGGVNTYFAPGDLVLIRDHVNLMGVNPLRGPNPGLGPRFPDMSEAYSKEYREIAKRAGHDLGIVLEEGVYAATPGPSYETPAEIRYMRAIGADLVGMSTVPETIVANHRGMKVLAISCVTNAAAGILPQKLVHEEVLEAGAKVRDTLIQLLRAVVPRLE